MINRLFIPGKKEDIKTIQKSGFNFFILPVEKMSIGFSTYYSLDEVKELSKDNNIYLMINKFFHHDEIDKTIELLNKLDNIKGFIVEDLGLSTNLNNKNVILFQNHLNMNYEAINTYYENGINSMVLSNELTIDEIKEIRKNTKTTLYYFMLGKNNIMYTRRRLLTNYYQNFNKKEKDISKISESISHHEMDVLETSYGTAILNDKIFSGYSKKEELENNLDYLIYNFTLLSNSEVKTILDNIDNDKLNELINFDDYFLHNLIYYKVKDVA